MKSIGFTLISIVLVGLLLVGGYFAITSMTAPEKYIPVKKETVGDLRPITTEQETGVAASSPTVPVATTTPTPATPTSAGTAVSIDLKTNIEALVANKTTLKVGAKGPAVGYVQKFMNLYFKKTLKVDNDFGKILQTNVIAFQKAMKLPQTGTVASQTLTAMVNWLSDHPQGQ